MLLIFLILSYVSILKYWQINVNCFRILPLSALVDTSNSSSNPLPRHTQDNGHHYYGNTKNLSDHPLFYILPGANVNQNLKPQSINQDVGEGKRKLETFLKSNNFDELTDILDLGNFKENENLANNETIPKLITHNSENITGNFPMDRKFYFAYTNDSQKVIQEVNGKNFTVYLDFDDSYVDELLRNQSFLNLPPHDQDANGHHTLKNNLSSELLPKRNEGEETILFLSDADFISSLEKKAPVVNKDHHSNYKNNVIMDYHLPEYSFDKLLRHDYNDNMMMNKNTNNTFSNKNNDTFTTVDDLYSDDYVASNEDELNYYLDGEDYEPNLNMEHSTTKVFQSSLDPIHPIHNKYNDNFKVNRWDADIVSQFERNFFKVDKAKHQPISEDCLDEPGIGTQYTYESAKYYYDRLSQTCKVTHSGNNRSYNIFATKELCERLCVRNPKAFFW